MEKCDKPIEKDIVKLLELVKEFHDSTTYKLDAKTKAIGYKKWMKYLSDNIVKWENTYKKIVNFSCDKEFE